MPLARADVRPIGDRAPAIDAALAAYVEELARRARDILGDHLVGVYLHGSATGGGFVPGQSDLDVLIVVPRGLGGEEKRKLGEALTPPSLPAPVGAAGLECEVVTLRTIRRPPVIPRMELRIVVESNGVTVRSPRSGARDLLFHFKLARDVGVAAIGPEPREIFAPIPRRHILEAMIEDTRWEAPPEYHVLNSLREQRYLELGEFTSKQEGGAWGRRHTEYADLVDPAMARQEGRSKDPIDPDRMEKLLEDTRHKLERALGSAFRIGLGEAAGAIGDLGILVPLTAALILVNGLHAAPVLLFTGLLVLASGLVFRIPFPVQPLIAITALAVAQEVSPDVIYAAGLQLGLLLLLFSLGWIAELLTRAFTVPVIRALQFGAGVLLLVAAVGLVTDPPPALQGVQPSPWPVLLAVPPIVAASLVARKGYRGTALALVALGVVVGLVAAQPHLPSPELRLPSFGLPPLSSWWLAFVLLVIPQLPLSIGNGVVATSVVARRQFGWLARRATPSAISLTSGIANVTSALGGGLPLGHGASGLTAHSRMGARTAGMNLLLGSALIAVGLFFAPDVPAILRILPAWALAGFLTYAGLRHALLVMDLRGPALLLAVVAGGIGAALSNLAVTAVVALAGHLGWRWIRDRRQAADRARRTS
jgi:SulP family sulfate permease